MVTWWFIGSPWLVRDPIVRLTRCFAIRERH
jgi:hypothetical protein